MNMIKNNNKHSIEMLMKTFNNLYLEVAKKFGATIQEYQASSEYINLIQNDVDYFYILYKIKNIIKYINNNKHINNKPCVLIINLINHINQPDQMSYESFVYFNIYLSSLNNFEYGNRLIKYTYTINENQNSNFSTDFLNNLTEDTPTIILSSIRKPTQIKLTVIQVNLDLFEMQYLEQTDIKVLTKELINFQKELKNNNSFTLIKYEHIVDKIETNLKFIDKIYKKYIFKRDLKKYLKRSKK